MKKILIKPYWLVFILMMTLGIGLWVYHDYTFVRKNFELYTGIDNYIIKYQYFDDTGSFIEVLIPIYEKEKLLRNFNFEPKFKAKLQGRFRCPYLTESDDYLYYLIDDGFGEYGYVIFALEKNGNTLQLYEYYFD